VHRSTSATSASEINWPLGSSISTMIKSPV
jgi:hypothetical protein